MSNSDEDTEFSTVNILEALGLQPLKGKLLFLKTTAEVEASTETVDVYIASVPIQSTGALLSAVKTIPNYDKIDLQHLRKVVRYDHAPEPFKRKFPLQPYPSDSIAPSDRADAKSLYVLICPVSACGESEVAGLEVLLPSLNRRLPDLFPNHGDRGTKRIFVHKVPLNPAANQDVALSQTRDVWPTIFNPNSSYGPNPALIAQAQRMVSRHVDSWMHLAALVGREAALKNLGDGVGVVVTEKHADGERLICVASDMRWEGQWASNRTANRKGDPAGHAVMRAIEFVAWVRRHLAPSLKSSVRSTLEQPDLEAAPLDQSVPAVSLERDLLPLAYLHLQPNGYLCLNMTFYITHEPCMMCSMALLHSRVARVVFGHRMPSTGGLCADHRVAAKGVEDGREAFTGYGLWWRRDLNWKMLAWEWVQDTQHGESEACVLQENTHA